MHRELPQALKRISGYILKTAVRALLCGAVFSVGGCMKYGPVPEEHFSYPMPPGEEPEGVFIVCEGNFMYGNASLSFYLPSSGELQNEVFARANGMKLGDVAQSMTIHDGTAYIVVNNSGIVFGIDPETFRIERVIRGIGSPRYICFNDSVAYVTSLYEPRIAVVDVATAAVADYIETPDHTSTEQMAIWGDTLYVSCWSYDDAVLMGDLTSGEVAGEVGGRSQPRQIALDGDGRLWVLTDGGYGEGSSPKPPALYRIDAASGSIEREFVFRMGDTPRGLAVGAGGDTVYFLNGDVWRMDTDAEELPREPFIPASNTIYYALGVDPRRGDIYVGDAIDYQQQGVVYRFSADGRGLDTLRVGIIPTDFCFR